MHNSHNAIEKLGIRQKTIFNIVLFSAVFILVLIIGSFISADELYVDLQSIFEKPSVSHLFGTDWMGRDMLKRTLKGLSLSMKVGLLSSAISSFIAVVLGILAPLIGGKFDSFILWLIDLVMSIPHTLLVILISIACGGGLKGIVIGVSTTHWTSLTRVIRAEVLSIKTSEYVQLSRQFGKGKAYIAFHHILPHIIPQLVVGTVLVFPHAILHEASVTFLGFGLPAHEPAIGIILSESMKYLSSGNWWLAFFPGLSLVLISFMVHSIGRSLEKLISPNGSHS